MPRRTAQTAPNQTDVTVRWMPNRSSSIRLIKKRSARPKNKPSRRASKSRRSKVQKIPSASWSDKGRPAGNC